MVNRQIFKKEAGKFGQLAEVLEAFLDEGQHSLFISLVKVFGRWRPETARQFIKLIRWSLTDEMAIDPQQALLVEAGAAALDPVEAELFDQLVAGKDLLG